MQNQNDKLEFILETQEEEKNIADENRLYDVAIIGAGPAGLSASVYAARKKLSILLVCNNIGGQVLLTSEVENYIGYQYIKGKELISKFKEQVQRFPIDMAVNEDAISIEIKNKEFYVNTNSKRKFKAKSLIIATGKRSKMLNIPGEQELIGKGVAFCATCDAPLFGGKDVAVIGGGNSALTAAIDLSNYANKVYIVNFLPKLQADPILIERVESSGKLTKFLNYEVKEIIGTNGVVSNLIIQSRESKQKENIPLQGVFLAIGLIPNADFVKDILKLNDNKEIIVNCACQTNQDGIFAAGDVTTVPAKQIIVAAGEGAKAALSAYSYLLGAK